eukprot:2100797-Prymnesium_polylepis.2
MGFTHAHTAAVTHALCTAGIRRRARHAMPHAAHAWHRPFLSWFPEKASLGFHSLQLEHVRCVPLPWRQRPGVGRDI